MKMTHPETGLEIDIPAGHQAVYQSQGWRAATVDAPKGNASLEEWQEFARDQGYSDEDLEDQSRDDLRAALS
ncbi:MAG TPA: hypothetical protein VNS46_00175 [Nocardioides sp.]|nr:hypothetical protein [Nocardioides sp.]